MKSEALEKTEAECAEGRTAPRVSLDDIKNKITHELYFTGLQAYEAAASHAGQHGGAIPAFPESLAVLTVCIVVMDNGFNVLGKSAPASAANFDPELGKKLAYEDAVRQIWPLMGFALRDKLAA